MRTHKSARLWYDATTMAKQSRKLPYVQVAAGLKSTLGEGHPWVYRDAVERTARELATGEWARVQCGNLHFYGLWDADSPIALRLFSSRQRPNRAWVADVIRQAWARRAPLRQSATEINSKTSAYRWLYGESDGIPGIVVDLYGDITTGEQWAVLRTYSDAVQTIRPWVMETLPQVTPLAGIIDRSGPEPVIHAIDAPRGDHVPQHLLMVEHGLRFEVDLLRGQKTGFFLDQRENRQAVGQWSHGRRVLNLFAYTGGFSLYAARGGAAAVTSVDIAPAAMTTAARNFEHNGIDPAEHEFIVGDCFEILAKYYGEGRRFDLIVVDPPSFAHAKSQQAAALHAYQRLNTLAMQCLDPGGILASSSCTSQVSPEAFRAMLAAAAADAKRQALILHEAGQPLDHPVPAHFPEGRYLKFVLAAIEPAR